jgi:hypothetical protein
MLKPFMTTQNVPIARCGGVSSLAAFIQLIVPKHSYNNMTKTLLLPESGFIICYQVFD